MQRMTDALSRMLNDPSTRMAMRSVQGNRGERAGDERRTEQDRRDREAEGTMCKGSSESGDTRVR